MITSFSDDFEFLSNFYPSPITIENTLFPTVEHAFQSFKSTNPSDMQRIANIKTPGQAKRLGRKIEVRKDWKLVKINVMRLCLKLKFANPVLKEKLLATGDAVLIEGNNWGDTFWGQTNKDGKWIGKNMLGILLMELRDALND